MRRIAVIRDEISSQPLGDWYGVKNIPRWFSSPKISLALLCQHSYNVWTVLSSRVCTEASRSRILVIIRPMNPSAFIVWHRTGTLQVGFRFGVIQHPWNPSCTHFWRLQFLSDYTTNYATQRSLTLRPTAVVNSHSSVHHVGCMFSCADLMTSALRSLNSLAHVLILNGHCIITAHSCRMDVRHSFVLCEKEFDGSTLLLKNAEARFDVTCTLRLMIKTSCTGKNKNAYALCYRVTNFCNIKREKLTLRYLVVALNYLCNCKFIIFKNRTSLTFKSCMMWQDTLSPWIPQISSVQAYY